MGWVVNATPRPLYPRERPGTHCIGGWVSPRAGLEGFGKSRPQPGFHPRTVQPVASRYADWDMPAHIVTGVQDKMFIVIGWQYLCLTSSFLQHDIWLVHSSLFITVQPKAKGKYPNANHTALLLTKQKVGHKTYIFLKHLLPDITSGP